MEQKYGKAVLPRVGELFSIPGYMKMGLFALEQKVGYYPKLEDLKSAQANTAFVHHSKKTFALLEADLPFNIRIDRNEKNFDIKSIGYDDFDGQLTHNVSAHPKVDAKTGDLCAFGYNIGKGCVHYSLIDKYRKLVSKMDVPITSPRMIHDFGITENYVMIPDMPFEFQPESAVKNGDFVFKYDKTQPSKYGIMKRLCQNLD